MDIGLVFDRDGTLIETNHLHLAAFRDAFGDLGVAIDEQIYRTEIMGLPRRISRPDS